MIFLDINMPKASGFEVCERIRESEWAQNVPIYALTSHDTEEDCSVRRLRASTRI